MHHFKKNFVILIFLSIHASFLRADSKEIFTMNGAPFTEEMFRKSIENLGSNAISMRTNPKIQARYLEKLIDIKLLSAEAMAIKLDQTEAFQVQLERIKEEILARLYIDQYIKEQTTEDKLKAYFNKHKEMFSNKEVRASHILFKEKDLAKAEEVLLLALKKDADFASLAKKYSSGPSGPKGGDLNFFGKGRMIPEFEKVAFNMAKGTVHPVLIKTKYGYHIIKVTDIKGGEEVRFEDKKSAVKMHLSKEVKEQLLQDLRAKAKVSINKETLKEFRYNP